MKLNIGQLLMILWWGFFNKDKARIFFEGVDSGMIHHYAYKRAESFKKPFNK
jgi:hypothetical protein